MNLENFLKMNEVQELAFYEALKMLQAKKGWNNEQVKQYLQNSEELRNEFCKVMVDFVLGLANELEVK
jgi:hypothetical protein|nr:MAG TPA: hypothetical protein [Caudoviricetes sp.]